MVSVNCMFVWRPFCILLCVRGAGSLQVTFPRISWQLASCQLLLMGILIGICKVEEGRSASHPASSFWQSLKWWQQQKQWQSNCGDSTTTHVNIGDSHSVGHSSTLAKGAALWWILKRMWHLQMCISSCRLVLCSRIDMSAKFWYLHIILLFCFCKSSSAFCLSNI